MSNLSVAEVFLKELFSKNEEFLKEKDRSYFENHISSQSPYVTFVTCSDSRVQLNSLFDDPIDKVFSVRNIGNQLVSSKGSIDYGVRVLKTPILLILGHTDCGAVNASLEIENITIPEDVKKELETLCPVVSKIKDIDMEFTAKQQKAVEENLNYQVLKALEYYGDLVEKGELTIVGAIYDFMNYYGKGFGRVFVANINGKTGGDILLEETFILPSVKL